jgi:hypothetical protein
MIKANVQKFNEEMKAGIDRLGSVIVKDKQFARAQANGLGAGAKIVAAKAKSLAPKGGKTKKGMTKTYGKTGLLKKSIKSRNGVSRKGAPFAVVGPSRSVGESVRRGKSTVMQRPSNYAHLVEFGFKAHSRVPLVTGRQHESIVKKGVLWVSSDLDKYMKKNKIKQADLTAKQLASVDRFRSTGQKSTTVPGQFFMERAWSASKGSIGEVIVERLKIETEKAIAKIEKKRKAA